MPDRQTHYVQFASAAHGPVEEGEYLSMLDDETDAFEATREKFDGRRRRPPRTLAEATDQAAERIAFWYRNAHTYTLDRPSWATFRQRVAGHRRAWLWAVCLGREHHRAG